MSVDYHDFIVPGLDTLIGDPSILSPTAEDKKRAEIFYIPENYIYRVIDFYHEQSGRGDSCRELTRRFGIILDTMRQDEDDTFVLDNGTMIEFVQTDNFRFTMGLDYKSSKSHAIAAAKLVSEKVDPDYLAIMTGSDQLSVLASLWRVDVAHINPDVYTGRRRVKLPMECASLWFNNKRITPEEWEDLFPKQTPLHPNEFVEFVFDDFSGRDYGWSCIGRFDAEEEALIPLKNTCFKNPSFKAIRPRTASQAMLMEALLAPPEEIPIVIVSGVFGTGKTFLSTAAGYYGVTESGEYERIFICPRDGSLGKEIGFVPGDSVEKTMVKAKPIADNMREILRLTVPPEKLKDKGSLKNAASCRDCLDRHVGEILNDYFEYESIIYMGGRSISNSFIILDEFQDTERYQARALLSRIGNGSKIIVSGDPTQITNPHLNRTSNGLSYSASKLAGKPEAIIVTLNENEIVRSSAAQAIANYLK